MRIGNLLSKAKQKVRTQKLSNLSKSETEAASGERWNILCLVLNVSLIIRFLLYNYYKNNRILSPLNITTTTTTQTHNFFKSDTQQQTAQQQKRRY